MSIPVITAIAVEGRINPRNLVTQTPRFTWKASAPNGPLTGYELRVSTNNSNWGTDGFIGEVWNTGPYFIPAPYESVFGFDGKAFPGCEEPKFLEANDQGFVPRDFSRSIPNKITYYFQLQVYDTISKSNWAVGFFMLDSPPTASNLRIVPPAPFHSESLEGLWDFTSNSGGAPSDLTRSQWFRNGVEVIALRNQLTVPSSMLVPNDIWYFTIQPSDGVIYGALVMSPTVTILNRAPQATALTIEPSSPRTGSSLKAILAVSDPDNDTVQVTIRWYKNGAEQVSLRNSKVIPGTFVIRDDSWYFTILPTDGYSTGSLATSPAVTILSTAPKVLAMKVENRVLPLDVKSGNPTFTWTYQDIDSQPQQQFQFALGTRPLRTQSVGATRGIFASTSLANGIVSTANSASPISTGNDVFDSGVVGSSANRFQYATADYIPPVALGAGDFGSNDSYGLAPDGQNIVLATGQSTGSVSAVFPGMNGLYDVSVMYSLSPDKKSTYKVLIDGIAIGQFTSDLGTGGALYHLPESIVRSGSVVAVSGSATDAGAKASFSNIVFSPVLQLKVNAGDFSSLSGYVPDGIGGIKLASLAGSASTPFSFPSGTYDIELQYTTETAGNPSISVSVNNTSVPGLVFAFESGAMTRSRFATGVAINAGDTIKILGTRNGGAQARVSSVTFRPTNTVQTGAVLKEGFRYFASVRAFDGRAWSDWATTRFSMNGSAWVSGVSNATGWTIEAKLRVTPQVSKFSDKASAILPKGT